MNRKGDSPFSGIIIAALIIGAAVIGGGLFITGVGGSYNVTNNDTSYQSISNSTQDIVQITNQTAVSFFGNKTSTSTPTAVDRMIGTAYGSILVLGSVPKVYVTTADVIGHGMGIDTSYSILLITGIVAVIIGIAIWLAVGRR